MPPASSAEAVHRIDIAGTAVSYRLRRSARRTIGLSIDQRGLRFSPPHGARLGDIETLIRQHGQWVLEKLAAWRERPPAETFRIVDGMQLSILGQALTLTVTPIGRARWQLVGDRLHLWPSSTVNPNILLKKALQEIARQHFAERLAHYATLLGASPPPLRLSSARTRWGSCNHKGMISLNWRLVLMPRAVVDYVVCHELAHLKEMNHSPRFWSVVEQLSPDWKARRLELRQLGHHIPII